MAPGEPRTRVATWGPTNASVPFRLLLARLAGFGFIGARVPGSEALVCVSSGMKMEPSYAQRFFAGRWPGRIWFGGGALLSSVGFVWGAGFEPGIIRDMGMVGRYGALAIIGAVLGSCLAAFPGMLFWGPLLHGRALLNGAPFRKGDRVQIVGGKFDGVQSEVYAEWRGDGVRVALGDEAAAGHEDVFAPVQLIRLGRGP